MENINEYFINTQKPWGKLFYQSLWKQLSFAKSMKILDFGSGLGITANHLAKDNKITAIEPNLEMCKMRIKENDYVQIMGDIQSLKQFPKESFDMIVCH